jgi:hypothetical protein
LWSWGKSLYFDCIVLRMRHRTENPCTWVQSKISQGLLCLNGAK